MQSNDREKFLCSLGNKIRALRTGLKVSQQALARKAGLHRTFIASVEGGKRNLSARNLKNIADALGVDLARLFEGVDPASDHILIADDSDDDFLLLKAAFRKAGLTHKLIHVHDGEQTMMYLQGTKPFHDRNTFPFPDLLMLDIKMPHGNGFEVLEELRKRPEIRLPVVMFSASSAQQDVQMAMELGAADYFVKPLSLQAMAELAATLNERWFKSGSPRSEEEAQEREL